VTFDLDISIQAPFFCALHTLSASVAAVYLTLAYSTTKSLIKRLVKLKVAYID
jgi:hypothetical protein